MASRAYVRVAHHISGFWKPEFTNEPLTTGSLGAGILIDPYLEVYCQSSRTLNVTITFDSSALEIPPVTLALRSHESLRECAVTVRLKLRPGVGYAVSAAATLGASVCCALVGRNPLLSVALNSSHHAEVVSMTGLGDVAAISLGHHLPIRLKSGSPTHARVDSLLLEPDVRVVTLPLRVYHTREMLSSKKSEFIAYGEEALRRFLRNPSLERFLEEAREFSIRTGLMKPAEALKLESLKADYSEILGYFVKKGLLVVFTRKSSAEDIASALEEEFKTKAHIHAPVWSGIIASHPLPSDLPHPE
uniref:Pantoate kinase n=1 Tax=Fervidicoccus fontis TaxID=683846 RepID=A0A7J3ZLX4_9CREN